MKSNIKNNMRKFREQHGETKTELFKRWSSMRNRVSANWHARKRYFDRGITVCKEWDIFSVFKEWAISNGFEKGLDLDRKDNNKGYTPDNCRWITHKENSKNRENTIYINIDGEYIDITTYCESLGISEDKIIYIRKRVCQLKWDAYKAVHTPIRTYKKQIS